MKNYIKTLNINSKNKDYVLSLINHLSAEGLTKTRQVKYVYAIGTLSRKIKKDFATVTKKDAEIHEVEKTETEETLEKLSRYGLINKLPNGKYTLS